MHYFHCLAVLLRNYLFITQTAFQNTLVTRSSKRWIHMTFRSEHKKRANQGKTMTLFMLRFFYEWQRILTKHTFVFAADEFLKQYWFSIKNIWRLYLYFSLKNSIFLPIISLRLLRLPLCFPLAFHVNEPFRPACDHNIFSSSSLLKVTIANLIFYAAQLNYFTNHDILMKLVWMRVRCKCSAIYYFMHLN